MRRRLLRLLVTAVLAFLLAWPLTSLRGDASAGFAVDTTRALVAAGVVFCAGIVFLYADALSSILAGAEPFWRRDGESVGWRTLLAAASGLWLADRFRAAPGVPPAARRWSPWVLCAAVAALPFLGLQGSWAKLLQETMVFATIAVGLQITIGMSGLLVLGHAGFWAVGAYTFGILVVTAHWNFWPAWAAAGAAAALVGLVVGLPALRLRGDYLAVVTLGFGEAIRWVIKNENRWTGGDANLPCPDVPGDFRQPNGWLGTWLWQPGDRSRNIDHECYWLALALLVACVVCVSLLKRSRYGRALNALREDETAAKCMGIHTTTMKLIAFTASALWAGLAGVVPAMHRGSINPEMFDFNTSVLFVAMVVLGGLGSIPGAILGAALLWIGPAMLQDIEALKDLQNYRYLFFGALMAAMMVVRPEGLLGGAGVRRPKAGAA